jgi:4-hydroxybenzoate polyprenyltransferase
MGALRPEHQMTATVVPAAGEGASDKTSITRPLVIADTALINDPLVEMAAGYLKLNPTAAFAMLGWLWQGRACALTKLCEGIPSHVETIPFNQAALDIARAAAQGGRPVYIAMRHLSALAETIKARLPLVATTISLASCEGKPRHPGAPAEVLAREFPHGFDYLDGSGGALGAHARGLSRFKALLEGLRLHQWVKNLLVFAPLVLGGELTHLGLLASTIIAFVALGLVASSTYLINDILDLVDDRRHWSKRERPIARGDLRASAALAWSATGLAAGLALSALLSWRAMAVLLIYVALTLAYSLALKRLPLVDGFILATQFTLRLALGVVAAQVPPSPWLFVFSMFLFTSLSLAKRHMELGRLGRVQALQIAGRGYRTEDAPLVLAVGTAAGLGAVIIIILYIIEDAFRQSFYGSTVWLWGFPPVVFLLICRIWLVTVRGEMNDDPIRFMLADRASQCLLAVLITCFLFAWLA